MCVVQLLSIDRVSTRIKSRSLLVFVYAAVSWISNQVMSKNRIVYSSARDIIPFLYVMSTQEIAVSLFLRVNAFSLWNAFFCLIGTQRDGNNSFPDAY